MANSNSNPTYIDSMNLFGCHVKQIPCIVGEGSPTESTVGAVGCLYMDTSSNNGEMYKCININDGKYTWVKMIENTNEDSGQNLSLDTTLTQGGQAADAKAVGDALDELEEKIPAKPEDIGAQPKGNYVSPDDIPKVPGWAMQESKPAYTASEVGALPNTYTPPNQTAEQVGADPKGTAASAVSDHNTNNAAHYDIRLLIEGLTTRLNALANSTDTDLDQMAELVAYIKSNKSLIDGITTSKVSVADIINNLTTNAANKPLSAAQGVTLKTLIDGLSSGKLDASKLAEAINTALAQAKASGAFDGKDGDPGRGIKSIVRTSGNGAAGTVDTYTITYTDGTTSTFTVRNGSNGAPGQAATLEITGVTALAPGAAPTVTEQSDSTPQARRYVLGIPQGAPGYTPQKGIDYATPADIAEIVQQVLVEMGALVSGTVDENKTITLSAVDGELPDGSYTVLFRFKDGSVSEIGKLDNGVTYTNLLPASLGYNGSVYNGTGYKQGFRITSGNNASSDPMATAADGYFTTGWMPYTIAQVKNKVPIYIRGVTIDAANVPAYNRVSMTTAYNSGSYCESIKMSELVTNGRVTLTQLGENYYKITPVTLHQVAGWGDKDMQYIRFSLYGSGAGVVITVDEPIE